MTSWPSSLSVRPTHAESPEAGIAEVMKELAENPPPKPDKPPYPNKAGR